MNTQLQAIQEAYAGIISEGVTPKFKTGDKVGIGGEQNYNPLNYSHIDTGTVSKIDRLGNHHVTFDNRKSNDSPTEQLVHKFDTDGMSTTQAGLKIIPVEDYNAKILQSQENFGRSNDINNVMTQLSALKNGYGNYPKLGKDHVATIKAILDKHTEE